MEFAKIINNFGLEFNVPLWRAKEMLLNKEIKTYDIIEVEESKNTDEPQTKRAFEEEIIIKKKR